MATFQLVTDHLMPFIHRLSRLRQTPVMRDMLSETRLHPSQLIAPLFIHATLAEKRAITSMPDCFQLPLQALQQEVDELMQLGIRAVILFGIPEHKDETGSDSFSSDGIIQQAIRLLRAAYPELLIITDVCFCEYTNHGHCGILKENLIDHEATRALLAKQAVSHAQAGADWVAPSGMIDGMVGCIREALDAAGYVNTAILSYAVKYQSQFYGPFREAAEGTPQFGDRATYQMNPANAMEALREAAVDIAEGADLIMVKPAMLYLDIIYRVKQAHPEIPLCAYQISGEYAMLHHAANAQAVNLEAAMLESLLAIKRAGADLIITYFAKAFAKAYSSNDSRPLPGYR